MLWKLECLDEYLHGFLRIELLIACKFECRIYEDSIQPAID